MKLSKIRAVAAAAALFAGSLGLAATAQAQALCPPATPAPSGLIAGQTDGVCLTNGIVGQPGATLVLYRTASEGASAESFLAIGAIPAPVGFTPGFVSLTSPTEAANEGGRPSFPGLVLPGGL